MSRGISSPRIRSIDILRGFIMVVMALDHARDYFSNVHYDPTDLSQASTILFLTRWITHFCAPVFIFLAGTSAFLWQQKGKTTKEASLFLLTRGFWMLVVEVTLVRFGWLFNFDTSMIFLQVIWAIGWSMICLSLLVWLPVPVIAVLALTVIAGHNIFDSVNNTQLGNEKIWYLLHRQGMVGYAEGKSIFFIYPLIPWPAVMAIGYVFGRVLLREDRNKWLYTIGFSAIILFILIRAINGYGDDRPWSWQNPAWRTILSFLNCEKYPPSLLYLLMTIGPAITVLPLLEKANNSVTRFFTVFGRVPMFYYIMHIYVLHSIALVSGLILGLPVDYFTSIAKFFADKPGWGFDLPVVYGAWILAIAILYLPCKWFMGVKQRNKSWWLSYI